jgi:hypothetical protein
LPDEVTGRELSREVRAELSSLSAHTAERVARHLVMAGRLLDDDPDTAYEHAVAARRLAPRIGAVREALGLAAYHTGRFADALGELRAARRITGDHSFLPAMADCERGLGRPVRALALAGAPEVSALDKAAQIEMRIVAAGARRDLGQLDAAALTLRVPELDHPEHQPWLARLRYAYADALQAQGKDADARAWFARAMEVDDTQATDAEARLAELDGLDFVDALDTTAVDAGDANAGNARGQPADADVNANAESEAEAEEPRTGGSPGRQSPR